MNQLAIFIKGWIMSGVMFGIQPLIHAVRNLRADVSTIDQTAKSAKEIAEGAASNVETAQQAAETAQQAAETASQNAVSIGNTQSNRTDALETIVNGATSNVSALQTTTSNLTTAVASLQSVAGTDCKLVHLRMAQSYTSLEQFDSLYNPTAHGQNCSVKVLFYTNGDEYEVKPSGNTTIQVTDGDSVVLTVVNGVITNRDYFNDVNGDNIKDLFESTQTNTTGISNINSILTGLQNSNAQMQIELGALQTNVQTLLDAA